MATPAISPMPDLLVDGYLDELANQRRLSPHTVDAYRRDLATLRHLMPDIQFCTPATAPPGYILKPNGVIPDQLLIQRLIAKVHNQGLQPRSVARVLSTWRSFFRWLGHQGKLESNPAVGVSAPRRSRPLPKSLNQTDAVRLVAQAGIPENNAQTDAVKPAQRTLLLSNKAIFELLYSSGLRVSELCSLDVRYIKLTSSQYESSGWLDLAAQEVQVRGKGNKARRVPVGKHALKAISAWLDCRDGIVRDHPQPTSDAPPQHQHALFTDRTGKRLSRQAIYDRLRKHAQKVGMPVRVHPHMLRHSFASHILQGSGDLRAVQDLLGHQSITSTQIYTSLDFQRLAQVYDQAHPRARRSGPAAATSQTSQMATAAAGLANTSADTSGETTQNLTAIAEKMLPDED